MSSGFSSAAALLDATNLDHGEHDESRGSIAQQKGSNKRKHQEEAEQEEASDLLEPRDFEIVVTMVGWKYYKHLHDSNNDFPSRGTNVVLEREPENEYDSNAIAVLCDITRIKLGHISKDQAVLLASSLDSRAIQISSASIRKIQETCFQIVTQGRVSNGSGAAESAVKRFESKSVLDFDAVSPKIAQNDVERSLCAPYKLDDLNVLPWNPLADWKAATETPFLPWEPFDASRFHNPPLSLQEIQATKSSSWPPSDHVFLRLGMAPANNAEWWYRVAGLKPPCEWKVTGALDCLPQIPMSSRSQAQMASTVLDGAMHGVTAVWHPDTLDALAKLMQEPMFWCRRSGDALIRAMGGPYVLGQQEEKLKLVCGSPHTELTQRMCIGHNLVYAAVHLTPPAAPGFNTLIFGCNLRGAGFHYHQDAVPSLKAKNAPLIPKQPVVTTVFYEQPQVDTGKEVVLWKPILNFSPVQGKSSGTGEYLGARVLETLHGMVHVQRAGLQSSAVHGIFHAPHAKERTGFRVAITARITKPNAEDTLRDYMSVYQQILGPEGDVQLRPKKS